MKTLVIIAGQLRTWDHCYVDIARFLKETTEKLINFPTKELIFADQKLDLLLCHWDISYQLYPDFHSFGFLSKVGPELEDGLNHFRKQSFIGEIFTLQEKYLDIQTHFKREHFSLPEGYHFATYLAYQACRVKRKIELQRGSDYDLVLILRPDVFYSNMLASFKLPHIPRFGEVYAENGAMALNVRGLLSTGFQDKIFLMNSATHNVFSNEIIYHVNNFRMGRDFTTAHFEKSLYLNSRNFNVLNLNTSLCDDTLIVRPTINSEEYNSMNNLIHKKNYLIEIEKSWENTRNESFEKQVNAQLFTRLFYLDMELQNLKQIHETLGVAIDPI